TLRIRQLDRWFLRKRPDKVGGHLNGRFCRWSPAGAADGYAGRLQISTGRFSTHTGHLLDPPQRPAELSQRDDLLFLFFAQDITHADEPKLAGVNVPNVVV